MRDRALRGIPATVVIPRYVVELAENLHAGDFADRNGSSAGRMKNGAGQCDRVRLQFLGT